MSDNKKRIKLATINEVADFLNVSRAMIYHLMDEGKLPYVVVGSSRRFYWSDVDKLVKSGKSK